MPAVEYQYTQDEIDTALSALVGTAGNVNAAIRYLDEEGRKHPTAPTLSKWARITHWERYEQLREQFSHSREDRLANDMLDAAEYAQEGVMLAVEKAIERLEKGQDQDPSRTAANLTSVSRQTTEKRQMLKGRPTSFSAPASPEAILRGLMAAHPGLITLTPETEQGQLEAGAPTEEASE